VQAGLGAWRQPGRVQARARANGAVREAGADGLARVEGGASAVVHVCRPGWAHSGLGRGIQRDRGAHGAGGGCGLFFFLIFPHSL
jgi:hypothetical protein